MFGKFNVILSGTPCIKKTVEKKTKRERDSIVLTYSSLVSFLARDTQRAILISVRPNEKEVRLRIIKSITVVFRLAHRLESRWRAVVYNKRDHFQRRDSPHYRGNYSCRYCPYYRCPIGRHDTGHFGVKITGSRGIVTPAHSYGTDGERGEGRGGWIRRSRESNDSSMRIKPT